MINNYCFRALVSLEGRKAFLSFWPHLKFISPFSSVGCLLRGDPPQRARTRLDEILENLTSPRSPDQPLAGRREDPPQSQEKPQQEKTSGLKANMVLCSAVTALSFERKNEFKLLLLLILEPLPQDDLTFGTYQPTLASVPEGRQSRRQSVRCVCVCLCSILVLYT